ncbi:MAG: T9SS type A sorting domain-containing protein [Bacteroidetes bacterium]|nr:T9SS type A sorting domain-containing protein [Bacteroidota bacterium]
MTTKIFQKTRGLLSVWSDPVNIYYKLSPNGGVKYRPTPATTTQQIQHITLFPNPAETVLTLNGVAQTGEYAIFDITGKAALRGSASANRIEVATLPPGSYMLHFSQGKAAYHLKFIKK